MGDIPRWFQLYWSRSNELAASFLRRAEQAGYGAIVVTLDTGLFAWHKRDLQNANRVSRPLLALKGLMYLPFLLGEGLANYFSDPVFRDLLAPTPGRSRSVPSNIWARSIRTLRAPGTTLPTCVRAPGCPSS